MYVYSVQRRSVFPPLVLSLVRGIGLLACGPTQSGTLPVPPSSPSGVAPTPVHAPASVSQQVPYRGTGFKIGFPQGWVVKPQANGSVTFVLPPRQISTFLVHIPKNAHGPLTSDKIVELGLHLFAQHATTSQQGASVPTATSGGQPWRQAVTTKAIVLATNAPQTATPTTTLMISCQAEAEHCEVMDKKYFQLMLQLFIFIP